MSSSFAAAREFVRGAAINAGELLVLSKGRALVGMGVTHTSVVGIEAGQWVDHFDTMWDASAIVVATPPVPGVVVIVGEGGQVVRRFDGHVLPEQLPGAPVMIRNARVIGGLVHACGMQRQVFVRSEAGQWDEISAPAGAPGEVVGFEDIDGYSAQEIYAVGWGGEVWQYDGAHWTGLLGSMDFVFTAVCCAPDGLVYAAGQQGVMIRGRADKWDGIEWERPVKADLLDLCWFKDRLYVATATGLFTLNGNALTRAVRLGQDGPLSCLSLSVAEGVLWAVGKQEAACFDGSRWRRYD